jgi:uncharacterized Zn-binding protein involved in type VI secretion
MPGIARVTDRTHGTCYGHKNPISVGGTIITGDAKTRADSLSVARIGDTVLADCGHTGTIISGSGSVFSSSISISRLGDSVTGTYVATIISASGTTFSDG